MIISVIMVENIKVQMIPVTKYDREIQFDFEKQITISKKKQYNYTNTTVELLQLFNSVSCHPKLLLEE